MVDFLNDSQVLSTLEFQLASTISNTETAGRGPASYVSFVPLLTLEWVRGECGPARMTEEANVSAYVLTENSCRIRRRGHLRV